MATQLIQPLASGVTDNEGGVVALGQATFFNAGTTTLTNVYKDVALTQAHLNPATLDAAGRLIAYTSEAINIKITDADSSLIRFIDVVTIAGLFTALSAGDSEVILGDSGSIDAGTSGHPLVGNGGGVDPAYAQLKSEGFAIGAVKTDNFIAGGITSLELGASAVTNAKIADSTIGADNQVIDIVRATNDNSVSVGNSSDVTIISAVVPSDGGYLVVVTSEFQLTDAVGPSNFRIRLRADNSQIFLEDNQSFSSGIFSITADPTEQFIVSTSLVGSATLSKDASVRFSVSSGFTGTLAVNNTELLLVRMSS